MSRLSLLPSSVGGLSVRCKFCLFRRKAYPSLKISVNFPALRALLSYSEGMKRACLGLLGASSQNYSRGIGIDISISPLLILGPACALPISTRAILGRAPDHTRIDSRTTHAVLTRYKVPPLPYPPSSFYPQMVATAPGAPLST